MNSTAPILIDQDAFAALFRLQRFIIVDLHVAILFNCKRHLPTSGTFIESECTNIPNGSYFCTIWRHP